MIERLENEIRACEDTETEFTNQIKECEVQIQANNENLVSVEDGIQNLKNKIVEHEAEIESFERKLETVRFFLKKRQVEIDKIKQKLDENPNTAGIKRELKEKQEEYEKTKKSEDELIAKHQNALDMIRTTHVEIRHKTQDIILLEDNIHDLLMQMRVLKQSTRKNQRTSTELQEKLESLTVELDDTRRLKPLTPFSRPRSQFSVNGDTENEPQMARRLEYKVGKFPVDSDFENIILYYYFWSEFGDFSANHPARRGLFKWMLSFSCDLKSYLLRSLDFRLLFFLRTGFLIFCEMCFVATN